LVPELPGIYRARAHARSCAMADQRVKACIKRVEDAEKHMVKFS